MVESAKATLRMKNTDELDIEIEKNLIVEENGKSDEALGNPESNEKEIVGDDAMNEKRTSPINVNPTMRLKMPHVMIDPPFP